MAQAKKPPSLKLTIKEPDEFITFSMRVLNFAQENLKIIITVVVAFLIAGSGWVYYQKQQVARQEKAAELYQASIGRFTSDIPGLLKELEVIVQDYPGTGGAVQARLLMANLLYQEKRYPEATAAFEALALAAPDLQILVTENLSYCYEAQKDYLKAAAVLEPLVQQVNLPYQQELQRRQAMLFELAGEKARALAAYRNMLQTNPPAGFIPYLQEKIKLLEGEKS